MRKKYNQILNVNVGERICREKYFVISFILFLTVITASFAQAAGTNILTVAARVLSKDVCSFRSGATNLNFGAIDSAGTSDISKTATMRFVCNGSSANAAFAFTSNDGLYETGPGANRMRNSAVTTEYLPYTLALSPQSGTIPRGVNQTLTITGTVTSTNYRSAYVGNYRDTVVISLNP
jgi:hypothetical protein